MRTPRMVLILLLIFSFALSQISSSVAIAQDGDSIEDLEAELDAELDTGDAGNTGDVGDAAIEDVSEDQLLEESLSEGDVPPPENLEDPTTFDQMENANQPAEEIPQPEEQQIQEPESQVAEEQGTPSGETVTITGLDYRANENGGTVVIKTSAPSSYTTRVNAEQNQFIIEVQNAVLPKKFQRPYNTKEFSGAIALINGYQKPGSTTARIVVQLREPIQPSVQQEGNSILVMALEGAGGEMAQTEEAPAPEVTEGQAPPAEAAPVEEQAAVAQGGDDQVLQGKTLDDFMSGTMKFYGSPISIQVKDGDLRDVFNFISEESGLNLVLTDEVSGKISLKLKEIPWDQALVVIMQSKQLGYIRQGNILRIAPLKTIRAETDATKEVVEAQKQLQPLKVKVFPISYAQAKDLEPQVQSFLTNRGKVKSDTRTNSVVVTDIPEVLSKVGKLLKSLDTQTPQVQIEGKIVEARDTFAQSIGIDWNSSPRTPGGPNGDENFANVNLDVSNAALTVGPLVGKLFNWENISGTLYVREQEGKIKVLSSPRIVTLNNVQAQIEQTTEIPIFSTTNQNGVVSTSVSYKTAKLQLAVTPQIAAEGAVVLNVTVIREFFGENQGSGGNDARPLNGRQAKTTVLVNNGDTAVIGGIYNSEATDGETGVPFLRKIPLIGHLFKKTEFSSERNELLIFLSPRVLNRDQAFAASEENGETQEILE